MNEIKNIFYQNSKIDNLIELLKKIRYQKYKFSIFGVFLQFSLLSLDI